MRIQKNKINSLFLSILLLLVVTDSYRLISTYSPLSNTLTFGVLTAALLVASIFTYKHNFKKTFYDTNFLTVMLALVIYPVLINMLFLLVGKGTDSLYWVFKNIQFCIVFILIYLNASLIGNKRLFNILCVIIAFSFMLNYISPSIIRDIGSNYSVNLSYVDFGTFNNRLVGFFLHPNSAALSIVMLVLLGMLLRLISIYHIIVFAILILSTGSRTALFIYFIICHFWLFDRLINSSLFFNNEGQNSKKILVSFLIVILMVPVFFVIFLFVIPEEMLSRYQMAIFSNNDQSLLIRKVAQQQYAEYFMNSPIIGHGTSYIRTLIDSNIIVKPSHNIYIERSVQFGFIGLILYLYMLFKLFLGVKNNVKRFSIFILLFYGFFINSFEQNVLFFTFIAVYVGKVSINEQA